jgi:fatty acid desaturase
MKTLKTAGILTAIASLTHVAIIFGGADWYRLFGAGEEMALMSENEQMYPAILTGFIALILACWSAYAFSGAGLIRTLPWTNSILIIISGVFLARGLFAIPAVLLSNSPYMMELAQHMTFMIITSIFCLVLGGFYSYGTYERIRNMS